MSQQTQQPWNDQVNLLQLEHQFICLQSYKVIKKRIWLDSIKLLVEFPENKFGRINPYNESSLSQILTLYSATL